MALARVVVALLVAGLLAVSAHADPGGAAHRVLVLHSYHHGFTWSDNISRGVREGFDAYDERVELRFEFMDTRRISDEAYLEALGELLAVKYAHTPVDVIIASDDSALAFLLDTGAGVFGDTPIVFCSVSGYDPSMRRGRELTGLRESIDVRSTLDLALELHPKTREVVVVTDMTLTGRALKANAAEVFREYASRVEFRYLEDLTYEELDRQIAALPDDAIVLLFLFTRDAAGRVFSHEENLERMVPHASVPIYALWQFYLGHGIVGGRLTNGEAEGRMAAGMAIRILDGEAASSIPLQASPTRYMFDHAQLVKHGIRESELPEDSLVVGQPFSLYQAYRGVVWSVVAAFAVLLTLVIALAVNTARRRRAEVALLQGKERLDLVVRAAELGTWDVDLRSGRLEFNDRFAGILGFQPSELAPGVASWRERVHDDDRSRMEEALDAHLSGVVPAYRSEHRVCTRTGEWRWVLDSGKVVERDAAGEPVRIIGIYQDTTERRLVEEERLALEARVQHAQKLESLGVLAGGIAHDFNNLLAGILGNADLALLDLTEGEPSAEFVRLIRVAALRAAELTNQMLAYSGKGRFVVRRVDLNEIVRDMAHLLEVSVSKKVSLVLDLAVELPAVEADVSQVRQVVMNLITNASEAIGEGSGTVTITTGVVDVDADYLASGFLDEDQELGRYVFFEVSDTGCGMDAQTQRRLFEPFFTTKFTGRGLGMSAVLGIVRGHRGVIRVYSEPDRGSAFKILFPAVEQAAQGAVIEREAAEAWRGSGSVLVADDEEGVRDVARGILEHLGFDVTCVADGRACVDAFSERSGEYTAVLLDMTMPHLDGKEAFEELKRIRPDIRVVLTSGYNEQDAINRFATEGLAGFVHKPFTLAGLADVFRRVLER